MNRFTSVFAAWVALFFSVDGIAMLYLSDSHLGFARPWKERLSAEPTLWVVLAALFLTAGIVLGFLLGIPDRDPRATAAVRARKRKAAEARKAAKPAKREKPEKPAKAPKAEKPAKGSAANLAETSPQAPEEPPVPRGLPPEPAPEVGFKSQKVWEGGGEQIHVLVLEPGAEAFEAITAFARAKRLKAASLTAIGAFERATVGWFNAETKTYEPIAVNEQCEVLSLIGDVATGDDGQASLHVHAVLGLRDGSTRGGHLLNAIVRPTLEVVVTETPAHLRRRKRPEIGAALIDLDR